MRIRDKLFPEGTKIRKILRKMALVFKKLNLRNIKKGIRLIKEKGIKRATKVIIQRIKAQGINMPSLDSDYQEWIKSNEPSKEELDLQRKMKFNINPKISLIVPMYNTPYDFFKELVECLINQTYCNWELCLADGSSEKNKKLEKIYSQDSRIKYKFIGENKGIAGNTNEAIKMASGDYIALFDHDDLLPVFSLYEIVKCINENPDVEFIYTDEDKITTIDKPRFNVFFKPDFSIDTLRSINYICHFSIFKKELMDKLGGERSKYDGAQDFDIILRMAETTNKIVHIPKVLYHWRVHPNSTAQAGGDAKPYAYEAGILAIQDHLDRVGLKGKVSHGENLGSYRTNYEVIGNPKISILIPNMDHIDVLNVCIRSILKLTTYNNYEIVIIENNSKKQETFDYYEKIQKEEKVKVIYYPEKEFNYAKIINFGVKNVDGEYIMQLNNDTELLTKNWLEDLLGYAQRKDVGAVGVKLLYPDNTIQHAGVIIGIGGVAGHILKNCNPNGANYFSKDTYTQNFSAVTAACIFSRKEIYEEVGYMEESFAVAFNDVDFCLKIREKGYLIIYDPYVELTHYESKSRGYEDTPEKQERFAREIKNFEDRWGDFLKKGDPYFNPNFSLKSENYTILTTKVNYSKKL